MSYRPEGFNAETIAKENMPSYAWGTQEYAQVIRGINIGADATLKALRKQGIHTIPKYYFHSIGEIGVAQPSTIIAIPDD